MSKDSSSRQLLGTIKFVFDKTKSRTLNATQAYDASTSQIVLASYPATSTIKSSTKNLGEVVPRDGSVAPYCGSVAVNGTEFRGGAIPFEFTAREAEVALVADTKAISLAWVESASAPSLAAKKITVNRTGTVQFSGALWPATIDSVDPDRKSNATKEIFAGNITVGTGLYRDWQNKYAVLKVDLLTNNAILRVYNE